MPDDKEAYPLASETVDSLSQKLDAFSKGLTTDEHAVLAGLLGVASSTLEFGHANTDAVTSGNDPGFVLKGSNAKLPDLSAALKESFKKMPGVGQPMKPGDLSKPGNPIDPLADSIGVGGMCVSWSKDYNKDIADFRTIPGLQQMKDISKG